MPHLMYKYRLYPNKPQVKILEHHIELCRQTHNFLLRYCRDRYKETKKTTTWFDMNRLITNLKKHNPQLYQVYSANLTNVSKRITNSYVGFFSRIKVGLKAGLPRYKKHGRYKSITYIPKNFKIDDKLHITRIGSLRIKLHRKLKGIIKTLTIKKTSSGKWFAIFSCEVKSCPIERPFKDVGIDVGLNSFAVLSDGIIIENPRYYQKQETRLKRLHRNLSHKKKGSNNRTKARNKLARLYEKIQNRRNDFLHKTSRKIVDKFENIYVEDLKIQNLMKNHHLAKSISDVGWGRFVRMLCYKAEGAGGRVIFVNPNNTSQRCSECGEIIPKTLSDRVHDCPFCGLVIDRDLNASRNILKIGRLSSELKPDGEMTTTQFPRIAQVISMKQEVLPQGGVAVE